MSNFADADDATLAQAQIAKLEAENAALRKSLDQAIEHGATGWARAAQTVPSVVTSDPLRELLASDPAGDTIGNLLTDAANVLLAAGGGPLADRLAAVAASFDCIVHAADAHAGTPPTNITLSSAPVANGSEVVQEQGAMAPGRMSVANPSEDSPWCPRCKRGYVQDAPGASRWSHPFSESGCRYSGTAVVVNARGNGNG